MGFATYLMILFGLGLAFYFAGYQPLILTSFGAPYPGGVGTTTPIANVLINSLYAIFTNPLFLAAIGVSAVTTFLLGGGAFSVFFIIPLIMISLFANIFIIPSSFLFDQTLPPEMQLIIAVFFNLFLMLTILEFVRGGST